MAQIGTLTTGAGVVTVIAGQSQCEEFIVIGDVDTANPLQGLTVEIDGTPFIQISVQALITAYMKWLMETAGTVIGLMLKISTGCIRKNTTYRFTNAGATTPAIFAFSDSRDGIPFVVTSKTINPSSYEDFEKFSALFINAPANIGNVEIVWRDGHKATMTAAEVDAYFALNNQSETDGRLGGVSVIDNREGNISSVRIFCTGTALNVLIAKLPNEAFQALKEETE